MKLYIIIFLGIALIILFTCIYTKNYFNNITASRNKEIEKYYYEGINNIINETFPNTIPKDIIIPLNIFQTWKTTELEPGMQDTVNKLKEANPEFKHYLYSNDDCREFIKKNFDPDVLTAFDCLIPGAYKADLWRCCILYKYGGVYLDIKYKPINGFKLINLMDREHYALDPIGSWTKDNFGLFNAIIISKPNNIILNKAIDMIVLNVKNKYYGLNALDPTGPINLGKAYSYHRDFDKKTIDLFLKLISPTDLKIIHKNRVIFHTYNEYRDEQKHNNTNNKYYVQLWKERAIYKDCFT